MENKPPTSVYIHKSACHSVPFRDFILVIFKFCALGILVNKFVPMKSALQIEYCTIALKAIQLYQRDRRVVKLTTPFHLVPT